ncbi:hypothetical protein [Microvirga solisilvae]|uniref:hypothetical protein n=1 Tax=Microvirga solisilvae TaxID=2919498 RepID=UPI001FAEBE5C|nr:hypothetical protein [Microvirga solisilvae]
MKTKFAACLILFSLLSLASASAAELKPYQKEALKKLEELHGGMWPMVRQQYQTVIETSSEKQVEAIVKMVSEARGNVAASQNSEEEETADAGGPDAWEMSEAVREDLEKQINKPYEAFVEHVAKLGTARHVIAGESSAAIYKAETGARLSAVGEMFKKNTFITNKSIADGLEEMRLARQKLFDSKKYHKVSLPFGNPPDNTTDIRTIVADAVGRITTLNNQFGKIAADIKKRMDAIPYGGGVNVNKAMQDLADERERHNKALSAEVTKIVAEMNRRIAEQDRPLFNWMIEPLKAAKPQAGPVARN